MNRLRITDISKQFDGSSLLNNINFEVATGDIISILGRNGCGKSTLLKILFGTKKADEFTVFHNHRPLLQSDVITNRAIAYLPQDPFLPKSLKVRDIIPMYFPDGDTQDKIFYAPNIHKIQNTPAGKLSLGELRYFELLLVANLSHPFLLLDEPFSMVEPLYKDEIKEFLLSLRSTKGIIITDHYYRDVLEVTTQNLLLKNGSLITINSENELRLHGYLGSISG